MRRGVPAMRGKLPADVPRGVTARSSRQHCACPGLLQIERLPCVTRGALSPLEAGMRQSVVLTALFLSTLPLTATPAAGQDLRAALPRTVTAEDYARAEGMLSAATTPLVLGGTVRPTWLPDGRFWYRTQTASGAEFVLVEPDRRRRIPAFDRE